MEKTELKNIVILATGGTIAGKASSGTQMTGYTAGAYSVADLLAGVPELGELAHISGEQLCNIDSSSLTDALLLRLAQRCNELLAQEDVDGVVITHGTDTMEETAFFLNLTVKSAKPVVLVGAMRPATAVSADGPLNIINAVKVAVDAASAGQGVLVMMNDEIYSGRDVTKTNTANVATFKALNGGPLGFIVGGEVHYYYRFYGVFDFMTLAACLQYLVILGSPGYKVGFAAFIQRCQLLHHSREFNGLLHILSGNHAKIHRILSLLRIKMRFDKALDASAVGERFAVQLHCADFDNLGKEAARTADRALVGSKFKIND